MPTRRLRLAIPPSVAGVTGWFFAVVGFVIGCRPLYDNSLFTHIATGRLIVASGIPRQDPYSFTAPGEPWVVQSWLVSMVYGVVERVGGANAIRVVGGLLVGVLTALTWRLTRPAHALLTRVAVLGLVLVVSGPFWTPRPLLTGLVLFATTLVIALEEHDPRWLVPVFWVWVNSHGSFPLGIVALVCVAAGSWLDGTRSRSVWRPTVWAAVGTATGAISPLGPVLLRFPAQIFGKMEILQRVIEWQSPNFSLPFARLFLAEVAVAVVALVRRPSYRAALPLVVFVAAALVAQRNMANAALMLVPGTSVGLAGIGRSDGRERSPALAGAAAIVAVVGLLAASSVLAQPAFDLTTYPTDAITWLDEHGALRGASRVATEDTVGNTLEVLYGTSAHVFFDDRYDMFPLAVARDYLELHQAGPEWEAALDQYRVQYLLWSRPGPLFQLVAAAPHWRILYQDDRSFVACRRSSGTPLCS